MGPSALPAELAGIDIPDWAAWLAQDADGAWWAYEAEPNQQHNGWYENEVGRIRRLCRTSPPADWQSTLTRLPSRA
jgi:hypothetical protein